MNNIPLTHILTGAGTEYFYSEGEAYVISNRRVMTIEEAPKSIMEPLINFIEEDKARKAAYVSMAGENQIDVVKQCIQCMFSKLDGTADLCADGKILTTEFVTCPKRSTCPFYGIGCNKATTDCGVEISKAELRVLEVYHMEEKDIAEKLFISPKTVHRHTQNLRIKTGIKKDKKLALWAMNKGIINQN